MPEWSAFVSKQRKGNIFERGLSLPLSCSWYVSRKQKYTQVGGAEMLSFCGLHQQQIAVIINAERRYVLLNEDPTTWMLS